MPKYIKGKDGKFAGSIGDGAVKTPPQAPSIAPLGSVFAPLPTMVNPTNVTDLYGRFVDLSREREETAREGISQIITRTYPTASRLIVEEDDMNDALNGKPTELIPVEIRDEHGLVLWEQNPIRREESKFEYTISELAQAVAPSRWELVDTDEGLGRRYFIAV